MVRQTARELAVHFLYLLIVCSLCYGNRSRTDYHMYDIVSTDLVEPKTRIPLGSPLIQNQSRYFSQVTTDKCRHYKNVHDTTRFKR